MIQDKSGWGDRKGQQSSTRKNQTSLEIVDKEIEKSVGITVLELADMLLLESVNGLGPQKFKTIYSTGLTASDIINNPSSLPIAGKTGDKIRSELKSVLSTDINIFRSRANKQVLAAFHNQAKVITYWHQSYPKHLYSSNYPVPILYVRGSLDVLNTFKGVACVGSRNIRSPYTQRHTEFAELAVSQDFTIVSGFALGADTLGHEAAYKNNGKTICVMPGGIDRPFPPENKALWQSLLGYPYAAMVTESPFGTAASALTLRKRNKLIAAFAIGVIVSQTASDGGAMNAFRFAIEQHKPIATFQEDGTTETSGNKIISQEKKIPVTVFPENLTLKEDWGKWLLALSSLI